MKLKDIKPGMEVQVGKSTYSHRRGFVVGVGYTKFKGNAWSSRPARYGAGGSGVLVAIPRFLNQGGWQPDVVPASQIVGLWADMEARREREMEAVRKLNADEKARREAGQARANAVAKALDFDLSTGGLRFNGHGYDMSADFMAALEAHLGIKSDA